MFATAALVLLINTVIFRATVAGAFLAFLQQEEAGRLEEAAPRLAELYAQRQNWEPVMVSSLNIS